MLTLEDFNKIPDGTIFATGILPNSPEGLYMINTRVGDNLLWLAKKGYGHDFAIYCHWQEKGFDFVEKEGDKLTTIDNIQKCVECSEEVLKLYRL
jgi:hypothetical protein